MSPPSAQNPLEARRFGIKFFAAQPFEAGPRAVVPIFHGWIQGHVLDDELLIDVADYAHVHHGPGVLLLSYEGQYSLDEIDGRLGLRYSRRRKGEGNVTARLSAAFRAALRACRLLQEEPALGGKLRFRFDEIQFHAYDRLLAHRSPEVFEAVKEEMDRFLAGLYEGADRIDIRPAGGPKDPFALRIQVSPASAVPTVDVLLSRIESVVT
ncbi:MAG: hypothetical protein ACREF4_04660 [Gammaproteobacteria bacterium]